jgi:hypothetical protein
MDPDESKLGIESDDQKLLGGRFAEHGFGRLNANVLGCIGIA